MTEEQFKMWQKRRDEAKKIEDPEARKAALEVVYDMKDDMQLDCQRKMADRIKKLVANDERQEGEMSGIRSDLREIKSTVNDHDPVIKEIKVAKIKAQGGWQVLKWLYWIAAAGGGGAVGFILALVKKAAESGN